ncbi:MarR family winged helix-turn-helix transcriptional regulator [Pararhizobium haloflavum]|uniref:MarR family winged helix-turn-helix transcriptional regulator n=1 Tax=Pararhizobium haloflavum TaxID=2037914 RepID=UPI000C178AEC|nr:MarR family winged helix-turn-helix transcriptional regulator [Pararhizobium haloflavum]
MQSRFDKQDRLYQAVRLIRPIHLNIQRTLEVQLAGTGISVAQRDVMEVLYTSGPLTVPTATRMLGMKRQFVQRTMSDLIVLGMVERRRDSRHSRAYICRLTDKGSRLFQTVHEREMALLRQRLGDINITEIVVALRVLARVAGAYEAAAADTINTTPMPQSAAAKEVVPA